MIGGVAPLGHPKPVRTLVDTALVEYAEVWAAGGVPQAVFPITPPSCPGHELPRSPTRRSCRPARAAG